MRDRASGSSLAGTRSPAEKLSGQDRVEIDGAFPIVLTLDDAVDEDLPSISAEAEVEPGEPIARE